MSDKLVLPLIALRGVVAYPFVTFSVDILRPKSIDALENAMLYEKLVFFTAQKDASIEEINENDLYTIGTVVKIKQILRLSGNLVRVIAQGQQRAEIEEIVQKSPHFKAKLNIIDEKKDLNLKELEKEAVVRMIHKSFENYSILNNNIATDAIMEIISNEDIIYLSYLLSSRMPFKLSDKQKILEENDSQKRAMMVLGLIDYEIEVLNIQKDIIAKVKTKIEKSQKEYYLREQIKVIQEELGEKDDIISEIDEYYNLLKKINIPDYAKEKVEKEIKRLKKMSNSSAESVVSRDYIDLILQLPWNIKSKENKNLLKAQTILNKEHYGLEKVKERIVEFLAVIKNSKTADTPILCLVGPPGVGKTSIAKSIAKSLNRKYVRIALGGVRDESEIRGHRKTYVGAMPGRIISSIKQAGTNNPLILLDEIDKLSSDYKGDPASALLEVLDGEQNFSFTDNYLQMPFDISDVLFVCTANSIDTVPKALRDRMEVILLTSYTEEEKLNIAMKFLLEKQMNKHNIKKSNLKVNKEIIREIINYYTRESGVRELERIIGKLCRKTVKCMLVDNLKSVAITKDNITQYLGKRKYIYNKIDNKDKVGVVCGLAWTSVGGDTLSIEVNVMKGRGKFTITGNIGKVMNESAKTAISYIRANSELFKIEDDFYEKNDIHIHIPEGAVPKDGPSAGITMATAMVSAFTNIPVINNVAMTGEITIRGNVLPIGGLKEKVLAAKRAGIKKVIIPYKNSVDLEELPNYSKDNIEFILAEQMEDVLKNSLIYDEEQINNNN